MAVIAFSFNVLAFLPCVAGLIRLVGSFPHPLASELDLFVSGLLFLAAVPRTETLGALEIGLPRGIGPLKDPQVIIILDGLGTPFVVVGSIWWAFTGETPALGSRIVRAGQKSWRPCRTSRDQGEWLIQDGYNYCHNKLIGHRSIIIKLVCGDVLVGLIVLVILLAASSSATGHDLLRLESIYCIF